MLRLVAMSSILVAAASATAQGERWYGIFSADGTPIGHSSREVIERADGREIVEAFSIRIQEAGQGATALSERTVYREDARGRTISIFEYAQNGRGWVRTEAVVEPGRAVVTRRTRTDHSTIDVPLPQGVRFDGGEGLLAAWDPAAQPRLEFQAFSLGAPTVERVTIEPVRGAVRDGEGRLPVLRRRYEGDQLRAVSRLLIGRGGDIREIEQPMFGSMIRLVESDRAAATRRPQPYSPLRSALVRAPYRVSPAALQGRIRYRFGYREGIEFPIPATGEQRPVADGDGGVTLDVCADCGPGLSTDPATRADALRPTQWLQSDHPRLRAIAEPVARMELSETRKMELLTQRSEAYFPTVDFTGHFSALETLSRRAGDCTEAAVLLAALGRAAGIPTRVASGLVYSREQYHGVSNVFMPHSWVLAYVDGRWRSFDAALATFDSTHIALTIGDGDARSIAAASQLAGLLEWRGMTEVRTRPSR